MTSLQNPKIQHMKIKFLRNIILGIICLELLFACARTKTERDDITVLNKPMKCYNGALDSLETNVDCGGPCEACSIILPPCVISSTSSIEFGNNNFTISSISKTDSTIKVNYNGSDYFTIQLLNPKKVVYPNHYTYYNSSWKDEFSITLKANSEGYYGGYDYNISSSNEFNIYTLMENHKVVIYLCSLPMYSYQGYGGVSKNLTAKIIIP
jgi:hypothetical protein